jgi:HEAT repeat protein
VVPKLPPEDQGDYLSIGPVENIPVIDDDDPRFVDERREWSEATAIAQALHSADELIDGLSSDNWMVRFGIVPRVIARARDDPRTVRALVGLALHDPSADVREIAVRSLHSLGDRPEVVTALRIAARDDDPEIRRWAAYSLTQLGYRA